MLLLKEEFKEELEEIKNVLRREIKLKAAEFDDLVQLDFGELENNACALIVLSVNKAFGGRKDSAIGLAIVFQYIFMADQVHRLMKDAHDLEESKRQFPVLVGDFLYGKFFLSLCKSKMLHFLSPLAKVIKTMNQGAISRWLYREKQLTTGEYIRILEMERASLTGMAARLGAELAGCPEKTQIHCEVLGRNLGLAWAAYQDKAEYSIIEDALKKARYSIREFSGSMVYPLESLVDYIEGHLRVLLRA